MSYVPPRQKKGGLSLRSFKLIVMTVLTNQIGRLLAYPSSLPACVLRAKYFVHGDLMSSSLGYRPLPVWRSIFQTAQIRKQAFV